LKSGSVGHQSDREDGGNMKKNKGVTRTKQVTKKDSVQIPPMHDWKERGLPDPETWGECGDLGFVNLTPEQNLQVQRGLDRRFFERSISEIQEAVEITDRKVLTLSEDAALRDETEHAMDVMGDTIENLLEQGSSRVAVLSALINEAEISIAGSIVDDDGENVFDPKRPQYPLFPSASKAAGA
jgi:hypothetical protein